MVETESTIQTIRTMVTHGWIDGHIGHLFSEVIHDGLCGSKSRAPCFIPNVVGRIITWRQSYAIVIACIIVAVVIAICTMVACGKSTALWEFCVLILSGLAGTPRIEIKGSIYTLMKHVEARKRLL